MGLSEKISIIPTPKRINKVIIGINDIIIADKGFDFGDSSV